MPDFIIVFDDPNRIDTAQIESDLQNRPGVEELLARFWKSPENP